MCMWLDIAICWKWLDKAHLRHVKMSGNARFIVFRMGYRRFFSDQGNNSQIVRWMTQTSLTSKRSRFSLVFLSRFRSVQVCRWHYCYSSNLARKAWNKFSVSLPNPRSLFCRSFHSFLGHRVSPNRTRTYLILLFCSLCNGDSLPSLYHIMFCWQQE